VACFLGVRVAGNTVYSVPADTLGDAIATLLKANPRGLWSRR